MNIKVFEKIKNYFSIPTHNNFEKTKKLQFIHKILILSTILSLLLGLINARLDTFVDEVLFINFLLMLILIPINKKGHNKIVAIILSIVFFLMVTFSIYDGVGVYDPSLIFYVIVIIFSSFLINHKATIISAIGCSLGIVLIYILQKNNKIIGVKAPLESQLMINIVILLIVGFLLFYITQSWEISLENNKITYDQTLESWARILEYRDHETKDHSIRVANLTRNIAEKFDFSEDELINIWRGALLHDIGKIGIPDNILLKPGKLTAEEFETIKNHPVLAKEIIDSIPFLHSATDIPYYHHERWNGTGYPEGLKEKQIPLSARIFAIVDVFDALSSDRPYRKACADDVVLGYIRDNSGILFDPEIVEYFLEYIKQEENIFKLKS